MTVAHVTAGLAVRDTRTPGASSTTAWPTAGLGAAELAHTGYNICLGAGHPDNIDYDTPVAVEAPGVSECLLSVASLGLAEDVDYYIDVLAVSASEVESAGAGPVRVRIESGSLVGDPPSAVAAARATASAAGKVRLEALYDATAEIGAATKILVGRLVDGSIDWSSPVQEIAIDGTTTIDEDLSPTYSHGERVHLAVRAETAAGARGPITILAPVVADTTAPPAPASLAAAQE